MPSTGIEAVDQANALAAATDKLTAASEALDKSLSSVNKSVGGFGATLGKAVGSMSSIVSGNGMIPLNPPPGGAGGGGYNPPGGGGGGGGSNPPAGGGGGGSYFVPPNDPNTGGGSGGGFGAGPQSFTGSPGTGLLSNLMNLLLIGPQYMFNRVESNRSLAASISPDIRSMALLSGKSSSDIMGALGQNMPLMGSPQQMTAAGATAGAYGYGNILQPQNGSGRFFEATRQMQLLTPGTSAPQLAQQEGNFLANTGGQQKALLYTGGAMSGFTAGAQPRTLQEWAEGVLKWFESLRGGKDRGKPFSADEISTQMFPGSNMRAWFDKMDTPAYMVDAFWKYAINMRSGTKSSFEDEFTKGQMGQDLSLARLGTATSGAQREMSFMSSGAPGASWYDQYIKREGADTTFNRVMGQVVDQTLGATSNNFMSSMVANTPTPIANMLAQMMMSTIPQMISGSISSIPLIGGMLGDPIGDVGDVGDYGEYGSTSTTGMDQSFGKRLRGMMAANPRLRINSGFREGTTQSRLAAKGVGRVTPNLDKSMHTKGLAADLGPRSEYGWIAQNASRFGLDQASRHGEPWHVGPPGTIGDPGCCVGCGSGFTGIGDPAMSSMLGGPRGDIGDSGQQAAMAKTVCGQAMMQIWPKELWPWALQVIYDESSGNPKSTNSTTSTGCFQVRVSVHQDLLKGRDATDPHVNASVALQILARDGLQPWHTSNHGGRDSLLPANWQSIAKIGASAVSGAGSTAWDKVTGVASAVVGGVVDAGSAAVDAAGSAISAGASFLKDLAGGPFDVFKDLAISFAKGDFGSLFDFDIIGKMTKLMNSLTSGMGFSPSGNAMDTSAGFANMLAGKIGGASGLSGIFNGGGGFWGGDPVGDPAMSIAGTVSPGQMTTYTSGSGGGSVSLHGGSRVVMNNTFNITGGSAQDASRTAQVVASHLNSMMDDRNRRAS